MKAQWKDYQYGSWLVLVFGHVDIKIVALEHELWGIITHPEDTSTFRGTLDDAKKAAETMMNATLTTALARLNGPV